MQKFGGVKFIGYLFVRFVLISYIGIILGSCGGDGGGGGGSNFSSDGGGNGGGNNSPPSIDNLDYSPQGAFLNDGDGTITVNGTFDFNDPDGDVFNFELAILDSDDNVVDTLSTPNLNISGITSGTLVASVIINTGVVDDFNFNVILNDANGNSSNTLSGTFPIVGPIMTSSNIPDTGIDRCYDDSSVINCPLLVSEPEINLYYGQDFHYSSNPMDFTNNADGTITDNVTSLMWQMDDAATYNWYEASGTFDSTENPASTDVCGELTFAGYTDWRLPSRRELVSIIHYGTANPAIDITYFPGTSFTYYWTLSEKDILETWAVDFATGSVTDVNKTSTFRVRCVRGTPWGGNAFVDNGDGTVSDNATGLMWQFETRGPVNDWKEMLLFCDGHELAGYTDWRMPDIKELETLLGSESDISFIPGQYCSSTTISDENDSVWIMDFFPGGAAYGSIYNHGAGNSKNFTCSAFYFRCVR